MSDNRAMALLPSYEVLVELAKENPEAFEALRCEMIERCINRSPEGMQLRLRQLQFRIDGIRKTSASPMVASQRIHALMWESFVQLKEELYGVGLLSRGKAALEPPASPGPPKHSASVICLVVRRSDASLSGRL